VRFQRSQQLARALAGMGHACVYEPQLGCEYPAPYLFDRIRARRVAGWGPWNCTFTCPEHDLTTAWGNRKSAGGAAVDDVVHAGAFRNAVQIVSFPRWLEFRNPSSAPWVPDLRLSRLLRDSRAFREILEREDALLERAVR